MFADLEMGHGKYGERHDSNIQTQTLDRPLRPRDSTCEMPLTVIPKRLGTLGVVHPVSLHFSKNARLDQPSNGTGVYRDGWKNQTIQRKSASNDRRGRATKAVEHGLAMQPQLVPFSTGDKYGSKQVSTFKIQGNGFHCQSRIGFGSGPLSLTGQEIRPHLERGTVGRRVQKTGGGKFREELVGFSRSIGRNQDTRQTPECRGCGGAFDAKPDLGNLQQVTTQALRFSEVSADFDQRTKAKKRVIHRRLQK